MNLNRKHTKKEKSQQINNFSNQMITQDREGEREREGELRKVWIRKVWNVAKYESLDQLCQTFKLILQE